MQHRNALPPPSVYPAGKSRRVIMPRGAYTNKQERKADHIEQSYEKRGVSKKEAEERAWRTVNKKEGGKKAKFRPVHRAAAPPRRKAGRPAAVTARAKV